MGKNPCEKYNDGIQKCMPHIPLNSRPGILKLVLSSDLNWYIELSLKVASSTFFHRQSREQK